MVAIGTLGVNHKTADLSIREVISRSAEAFRGEKAIFFSHPTVLLSTCNRTEIYFSGENLALVHQELLALLRSSINFPFEHLMYSYFGIDCFAHLARVTAGLDSAIFAETEIQRQVKLAYSNSKNLSSILHFVFQKALKVGKNVRSRMDIQNESTLYSIMWQLTSWRDKRILLVGYSEINRGLISYLEHKGIHNLTLCTRCPEIKRIRSVGREALEKWQEYDVIVCASQAPNYLISGIGNDHHILFDLGVPRGIDPDTKAKIYNIEELNQSIRKNGSSIYKNYFEDWISENISRLSRIYQNKLSNSLIQVGC